MFDKDLLQFGFFLGAQTEFLALLCFKRHDIFSFHVLTGSVSGTYPDAPPSYKTIVHDFGISDLFPLKTLFNEREESDLFLQFPESFG